MRSLVFSHAKEGGRLHGGCLRVLLFVLLLVFLFGAKTGFAGPPFKTDDPEPVEYQHGEVYIASQYQDNRGGTSLTAPHIEVNYGLLPEMQVHLIAPFVSVQPEGERSHYGYGDTEIGVKYRFVKESDLIPSVAVFPLLEIPTGNQSKGLGSGEVQAFLPVWLQKSFGAWTTYGGGGYWINPGEGNKNYWFFGWELQREISKMLSLGGEIFHQTPSEDHGDSSTGFNLGGILNLTENHHILFSAGRDFSGPNLFSSYVAYQFTF
jgi:hypothetical protein